MSRLAARLSWGLIGSTAVVVAVAGAAAWLAAHTILYRALDERLRDRAQSVAVRGIPIGALPRELRESLRDPARDPGRDPPTPAPRDPPGPGSGRGEGGREWPRARESGEADGDGRDPAEPPAPQTAPLLLLRGDTRAEIYRNPWLPPEVDLAAQAGSPVVGSAPRIVGVRLPDGRSLRVVAIASQLREWRGRRRESEGASGAPAGAAMAAASADRSATAAATASGDGSATAAATVPQPSRPPLPLLLYLGTDATPVADNLRGLGLVLAALWAASVALAVAGSSLMRRAILRPVHRIADDILAMDARDLSQRVPDSGVPDELALVIARLNALLANVESAFRREKTAIANIAHELRTPVAGLRTTLEFALARDAGDRTSRACLEVVVRMQDLIATLLALARLEAGQEPVAREPVDVAPLLRTAWDGVASAAAARGITVAWTGAERAVALASADKLRTVFGNLLGNAVEYAPQGSEVSVLVTADGAAGRVGVRIANRIDGPAPDVRRVFEPFWRGDQARTAGGSHCGLGLALVQRLVRLLGGEIDATIGQDGSFVIAATLPKEPAADVTGAS